MLEETVELVATDTIIKKAESDNPLIFTEIYHQNTNIAFWKRNIGQECISKIDNFLSVKESKLEISLIVSPNSIKNSLSEELPSSPIKEYLLEDISQIVDMFCCLFDLKQAGLRLVTLTEAMCPRFHVDRVPCRLVTTYSGIATEWLNHQDVDRAQLGKTDHPIVNQDKSKIQLLNQGDVALLKGELWKDNTGRGLVHRSPTVKLNEKRILLTLDFI